MRKYKNKITEKFCTSKKEVRLETERVKEIETMCRHRHQQWKFTVQYEGSLTRSAVEGRLPILCLCSLPSSLCTRLRWACSFSLIKATSSVTTTCWPRTTRTCLPPEKDTGVGIWGNKVYSATRGTHKGFTTLRNNMGFATWGNTQGFYHLGRQHGLFQSPLEKHTGVLLLRETTWVLPPGGTHRGFTT